MRFIISLSISFYLLKVTDSLDFAKVVISDFVLHGVVRVHDP